MVVLPIFEKIVSKLTLNIGREKFASGLEREVIALSWINYSLINTNRFSLVLLRGLFNQTCFED